MNQSLLRDSPQKLSRRRSSLICPIYNEAYKNSQSPHHSHLSTMERTTQTEPPKKPKWKQVWLCFVGDDKFRRQRQKEAIMSKNYNIRTRYYVILSVLLTTGGRRAHVNSVSLIDRAARILFPFSFFSLNLLYWLFLYYQDYFHWIQR
jgi:gamma-aminobutyric acid receptor subunit alpha